MLLRRRAIAGVVVAGCATACLARAQDPAGPPPAGDTVVAVRTSYYEQPDHGGRDGNPFLDEHLVVIEPAIFFQTAVTDDVTISALATHDHVSSASIARLDNYPQQSGASGDLYFGLDLGVDARLSSLVSVGLTAHGAGQTYYASGGLTARAALQPLASTRVALSLNTYIDEVRRVTFDGRSQGWSGRDTATLGLSAYHALTPWLHGELGYSFTWQDGFLQTSFNSVVEEGGFPPPNLQLVDAFPGREVTEELPGHRLRHTVEGRVRWLLRRGTSLELGGRLYGDSWGVGSVALEPGVRHWLIDEVLMVRLGYRFHRQARSDYFHEHVRGTAPYHRTQDPDLGAFTSHGVGLKVVWHFARGWSFDVAGDLIWRSDGLDQRWVGSGIRCEF